ncbi:Acyltransferase family protein [Polystyrenella longa]|uniref:Acyltransferase family protein n=1 Tax=Polystyrenella longa TaxID=2528007 RepID=A0A518CLV5_9PLAN|nr:acyltransferase family protein [Polystyrenella longa]QDU80221.1 Acyltransferase family protein [Polystyrenella longa]
MSERQRNLSLDIAKLVLIGMVVAIHCEFLKEYDRIGYYLYDGLFRIAVPCFLLINGYFFYKFVDTKPRAWVIGVLERYAFWMMFYSFMWLRPDEYNVKSIALIIEYIILGFNHLWYLSAIIGASLLTLLTRKLPDWVRFASIIILYLCGYGLQYFREWQAFENPIMQFVFETPLVYRNFLFVGFPFFIMGYLINKYKMVENCNAIWPLLGIAFGVPAILFESHLNMEWSGRPDPLELLFPLIWVCPAIFILIMKSPVMRPATSLGYYANGIYFIHIFFLAIFKKFIHIDPVPRTLAVFAISFIATFFLIRLNKKFPFIL